MLPGAGNSHGLEYLCGMKGTGIEKIRRSLLGGAIGGAIFIVVFIAEGWNRNGYSAWRFPVSSLSIGPLGWIQQLNFILCGFLFLRGGWALDKLTQSSHGSKGGPRFIGLVGIGLIGAGFFNTDGVYGYPAGPMLLAQVSWHGHLHDLFSMFVFIGLPASCFVYAGIFRKESKHAWAAFAYFSLIAIPLAFIFASLGFKQVQGFAGWAGCWQRITIVLGWLWLALLWLHYRATLPRSG